MKYLVKITVLFAVFIGAIYFFGSNMDETVFSIERKTIQMEEATLPTIQLRSDGVTVNRLYGYTTSLDLLSMREDMISVEEDHLVELLIDERSTEVRKLLYEVVDTVTGEEVFEDSISAFDKEDTIKVARVKPTCLLISGREYAVRVTLVTSESKRVYYYFRMKYYNDTLLAEKIDYILSFSENCRKKDYNAVIPYLESTYRGEGTSYAHVNIKDSFYMVCWGDLEPKVIGDVEFRLSEVYSNIAVGTLRYMIELETESGQEQYYVTEQYRVIVTSSAKHLLNYERSMENVFEVGHASLSQSEFKMGVTADLDIDLVTNSDCSMLAFVRNKELWHYNLAENAITKAVSFRQAEESEIGGSNEQYDVRIMNMDESGDVNFMVYGYMNRGEYEGKTGIVLYHFYHAENRIEEQVYIPINQSYQRIKEGIGSLNYMNRYDVFYFMAYDTLYRYNLTTKTLEVLANPVSEKQVVFSRDNGYVAWQEVGQVDKITLLYLESEERVELTAKAGGFIRLLGRIDENMLCAYGNKADCIVTGDGDPLYPAEQVQITDANKGVLKTYQKEGYYVTDAEMEPNSIRLERVAKTESGSYIEKEDDYILNYTVAASKRIYLTKRVTEKMFAEYYIHLPSNFTLKEIPTTVETLSTVISEDTTLRIAELEQLKERYEVYSFGNIAAIFEDCAEAIALADHAAYVGTVINQQGKVIWERGVKYNTYSVKDIVPISCKESGLTSRQAVAQMLLNYFGVDQDASLLTEEASIKEYLSAHLKQAVISANGVTLDEALYFIYKGAPIYAMKNQTDAILITAYNASGITYYDPSEGQTKTMSLKAAQEMFNKAGDIYITVFSGR